MDCEAEIAKGGPYPSSIPVSKLHKALGIKLQGYRRLTFRLLFAYHDGMGEMKRAIAREQEERRTQDRFTSTLVISVSIIAAVRLAREVIGTPSPRVNAAITDSIRLARMILRRVDGGS